MAASKWIADLSPDSSYLDAARHVLSIRLEAVRHFLESIRANVDKDPEQVHQLRVNTRRAKAALDVFSDCLPKKARRKTQKSLKVFRRSAGAVRDWDVFLLGLSAHTGTKNRRLRPAVDLVNGLALSARDLARTALIASCQDQPFALERLQTKTLAALRRPSTRADRTLGDVAVPFLSSRLESLQKSADAAIEDDTKLHLVRIAGKRLRYAMEFFGGCFTPEFRERLYPQVEQLQELLGVLHDSAVARVRLQEWRARVEVVFPDEISRYRPGFDALIKTHDTVIAEEREKFRKSWREWENAISTSGFEDLQAKDQRGEFVSIAGNDNTAPAGREVMPSPPVEEVGLTGAPPGGSA
jgi:CHAD domain-containing protein